MRELLDDPLAPRTTLQVGGRARRLIEIDSDAELLELLATVDEPFYLLGGGSNVVIADGAIDALFVAIKTRGTRSVRTFDDAVDIYASAGEVWDELVASCVADGLAGIECLSGIPGLVGATPIQNVGAYGQQVSDTITSVSAFDLAQDRIVELTPAACGFDYRTSIFKRDRSHVITGVTFRLRRGDPARPRYAELQQALLGGQKTYNPTAAAVRDAVLQLRRGKSMVVDPADPDSRSAGSFFLNPIVDAGAARRIEVSVGQAPPQHLQPDGRVKLSAGWLIEQAGFQRGFQLGQAALSRSHALAIVNPGKATAADIMALADRISDGVLERFGIALRMEPVLVGSTAGPPPLRTTRCRQR